MAMHGGIAMSDYLPKDVRDGLEAARKRDRVRRSLRRIQIGDDIYPILEYGDHGFAVDAEAAPRLRGLVDIFDGSRHLCQALIVASQVDGDMMRYEFKRNTPVSDRAPIDFERAEGAPVAFLPSS